MALQEDSNNNIILFGKNGQVGSNLYKILSQNKNLKIHPYSSNEVDFSNPKAVSSFINKIPFIPSYIINAAAYTNVDKAQQEAVLANNVNHLAVKILADYCKNINAILIHYSTDYVFDGDGNEPFKEDNKINLNPLNIYGKTKLLGEEAINKSKCKHLILRTSWIWNIGNKNFVKTISKLAIERKTLAIISDQIGSPTYAKDLANLTYQIITKLSHWEKPFPSGIYHLTNQGYASWHDLAISVINILKENKVKVEVRELNKIKTSDYKTAAIRPLNSRLDCSKIKDTFGIKIRSWQDALRELINT